MDFHVSKPILVIGIGKTGEKFASMAKELLDCDVFLINDGQVDSKNDNSIEISTGSIINPSTKLIRGHAFEESNKIQEKISGYSTVMIMANLAGKTGAAVSPVVSSICKENKKNTISFAIMPFKFEKDRIFNAGLALKRLRVDSDCTVVLDNDAMLDSNPDLTVEKCYEIADIAVKSVIESAKSESIPDQTNILTTSKKESDLETSLKDSIRMLYEDAPPNSIKRSMLYVYGENVPLRMMESITSITSTIFDGDETRVGVSMSTSEESRVVMMTSVQGETRFDKYDPLSIIPSENTLDFDTPECSINLEMNLEQIE